ncbi:hypothetical protein HPB49_019810 [Dermacentor silvarum]|uniref:Uncharacterized protein n=1 Tax=Dermacentor silvarum TaxID=543639 RepID=A0ACB8CSI9_DERSI|nr:hypothetical protein HPB49_019810 [Dermacentor silvarum]
MPARHAKPNDGAERGTPVAGSRPKRSAAMAQIPTDNVTELAEDTMDMDDQAIKTEVGSAADAEEDFLSPDEVVQVESTSDDDEEGRRRSQERLKPPVITFDGPIVPRFVYYYGGELPGVPERPTRQYCKLCKSQGHRTDVCPAPTVKACSNCWLRDPPEDHTCEPECALWGGGGGLIPRRHRNAPRNSNGSPKGAGHNCRNVEADHIPTGFSRNAGSARTARTLHHQTGPVPASEGTQAGSDGENAGASSEVESSVQEQSLAVETTVVDEASRGAGDGTQANAAESDKSDAGDATQADTAGFDKSGASQDNGGDAASTQAVKCSSANMDVDVPAIKRRLEDSVDPVREQRQRQQAKEGNYVTGKKKCVANTRRSSSLQRDDKAKL